MKPIKLNFKKKEPHNLALSLLVVYNKEILERQETLFIIIIIELSLEASVSLTAEQYCNNCYFSLF